MLSIQLILALLADRLLGEVSRFHPLVGFGRIANWVEACSRARPPAGSPGSVSETASTVRRDLWAGRISWTLLVVFPSVAMLVLLAALNEVIAMLAGVMVLYFCIGGRSLSEHACAISAPLNCGDLSGAREALSRIVSRDTAHLDAPAITNATVESVLENGSDALLAPLFWYAVAGAPGALCYRLANTLDAMWGYRSQRYLHFGQAAARMDDALNWLPARCCAFSYALVGRLPAAVRSWRSQAHLCDSPNAGPVMAAGAGALGITVGGTAIYDNEPHWRPTLGEGRPSAPADIERAIALLRRATVCWLLVILALEMLPWH